MKKLLALILAIVFALAFVACEDKNEPLARAAAEGFMNAFCELNASDFDKYVDDADALAETFKAVDADSVMNEMPAEIGEYADDFKTVFEGFLDKLRDSLSYEIIGVEKVGDDYVYSMNLTYPDSTDEFGDIIEAQFSDEVVTKLAEDLFADGTLTETSTETEMLDALMGGIIELAEEAFAEIEIESVTETAQIVVSETDGKWLVNAAKTNIDK